MRRDKLLIDEVPYEKKVKTPSANILSTGTEY